MIRPTFKFINDCKARELVRFTDQRGTHWALVGERNNELLILLVLPLDGSPYCTNVMGQMDILRAPFDRIPVLSYQMHYLIRVDVAGDCEIGGIGKLISAHGAYVMTSKDEFICCKDERVQTKTAYYDLATGVVRGEPGSERAVFARWELDLIDGDEQPTRLIRVQANKPTAMVGAGLMTGPSGASRFDHPG